MKTKVTDTSLDAYREITKSGEKETMKVRCLSEIRRQGKISRRKLKRVLRWESNQVSGRVNDLIREGKVIVCGKEKDPLTNKTVQLLQAV